MTKSAREELTEQVNATDVMLQVRKDLEEEPMKLLCIMFQEHQKTLKPVPDHRLPLFGYFAEAGLRALLSAGLVKPGADSKYAIYEYELTDKGKALATKLHSEGYCKVYRQ